MGLDLTSFDAALKEYYTDQTVQDMVYKDNPFFALVPKSENFYGRNLPVPILYANPQARSSTFARAKARSTLTNTGVDAFLLTRVSDYGFATIQNEVLEASMNDKGAFMEAATTEIDGILNSLTRSAAIAQYKSGFGDMGQIGSISTNTITLLNVTDVTNFEVGQELDLSTSLDAAVLKAYGTSTNGLIVTGVNRATGVLTFGFNVTDVTNGIPTAAANDFIFTRGDRQNSVTPARTKIAGLAAWLPDTVTVASTSYFGVDRSVDRTRLAGIRYDGSALPIEEAVIDAAALLAREGGSPDHMFLSFSKWGELEKALGSKVQYVDLKVGSIGFRGLRINGPKGEIKIIPDVNCPSNRGYMLTLNTWKHYSLGKPIRILQSDGLKFLRQTDADGVEVRTGYYANLSCNAPGKNSVVIL